MAVFDEADKELTEISNHASERSAERFGVTDDSVLLEMVEDSTKIVEAKFHLYKRDENNVYVLAKGKGYNKLKTVMHWNTFKKNIQEKIERYN